MTFNGAITYEWNGVEVHAVTGPELRVGLHEQWVTVGRPMGGTQLVAWESVRSLNGYAAVAMGDR